MQFIKKQIITVFITFSLLGFAQKSAVYTSEFRDFQKALTLYNNKQYKAAQSLFDDIRYNTNDASVESDCSYYIANCAVRLNQTNADDLVIKFVENYPTSTKRNTAYLDVGDYYFENSKFAYARKWYEKVDELSIARIERERFYFNYGYSLYATDSEKQASKYFNRVVNSKDYGSQAKYYIGFMAYKGDDYDKANAYFDQVSDNEKYKEKLSYYQADLNFKLGKFEDAIELAKAQLDRSGEMEASELSKIIGESYFNLQKYSEAIPYLQAYQGKGGKWNNTDYYQLGYAFYKQNNFEAAISEFNKIVDGNNAVAQNAYYHLGESYINLNKKQEALNAFRNASQMDYDKQIQEDAWLNYAKISYDIGNPYRSVPAVLTSYLDKYPDTSFKGEVETLLIDSYISSKNYREALELLKGKNSYENKLAYQKVAFLRGIELYNEAEYNEALQLFTNSLKEPRDETFVTKATFWRAETEYHLNNYNDALIGFKQFKGLELASTLPENEHLDYNIAYTYFKLKDYEKSANYFQTFINDNTSDRLRRNDAYLRLGDAYFVTRNYVEAISAYDKAVQINQIESDYASFQKAMSQGYMGRIKAKMTDLRSFIKTYPKSALRDDAMYELANTFVKSNETDEAMQLYDRLNTEYKDSGFRSKALLRQGLVYYNGNNNERALTKFKNVARDYPGSGEALQAISTARLIYIDLGRVDDYARWVETLDYIEVSDAELDNSTYSAAEKPYLENDTAKAIKQFNIYINQFPNGIHVLKSHFYLGQLYYSKDLYDNAKPHYKYVVDAPKNEYSEQSAIKLSEIYLKNSNWVEAIPLLQRLENEADYPQNVIYAQSNLMKAYYQMDDYEQAQEYADLILETPKLDTKIKTDAQIIVARTALKTGDETKSKQAYAEVERTATGRIAAEALFYNAYFKNKDAKYEASNATIQKLAKDYSSYKYYSAKGLVVMAKNYDAIGDAFQATYILESVISNFSDFNDVVQEAKQELERIKSEEAKTNSSIETDDN